MHKIIIEQNTKAINDFFTDEEYSTKKELSNFLFKLQGLYFNRPGINLNDNDKDEGVCNFDLLYNLVNSIQPLK